MNAAYRSESDDNPQPDFVAELTPYRSLGRTGYVLLMGFIATTCLISGLLFLVIGAWPVFVFMGLDVLLIWFAFWINYRAARAFERISVGKLELRVQKFDPSGKMIEHVFNPFGTRFEIDRHDEVGITTMRLTNRGESLTIGSFLNPADKESFALAFGNALGRAKT